MSDIIIETNGLCTDFEIKGQVVRAVSQVSLSPERDKALVILGGSDSKKDTYMKALPRILPRTTAVEGQAEFLGSDLFRMNEKEFRDVRGNRMAIVHQDPLSVLGPVYKVGYQIVRTIRAHSSLAKAKTREQVEGSFIGVGAPSPREQMDAYSYEISGNMRQRVVIAMALCCNPCPLLADKPATVLNIAIQKQILDLFLELQESNRMSIAIVTHNIDMVAQVADRIAITYDGIILECGITRQVLETSVNPYIRALIAALPRSGNREWLVAIEGQSPTVVHMPSGCPFSNRYIYAAETCGRAFQSSSPSISTIRRCVM